MDAPEDTAAADTTDTAHAPPVQPRGHHLRGLPRTLDNHNDVTIGSSPGCHIVIEGADPLHATLCWENGAWVIHDDPAPAETLVNNESVDSRRLEDGDWIGIAGVRIQLAGNRLVKAPGGAPDGLCVTVDGVSAKVSGEKRLDHISFVARPGRFVALLGPSGCGKSTLLQRIAGLAPYDGKILLNDCELGKAPKELRNRIAYLPQAVADTLHGDMTVLEEMENFAWMFLPGEKTDFVQKLAEVGLPESKLADRTEKGEKNLVAKLSGGEKRRLALALALMRNPQLLLLDEPTAGLDPASESDIMDLLARLARQGRTVICATHVLGSLNRCNEFLVLAQHGRQEFFGCLDETFEEHFGTTQWLEVYRKLVPQPKIPQGSQLSRLPGITFKAVFSGTLLRLAHGAWRGWNGMLSAGIPLLVALVLTWACGGMFGPKGNQETICFCMAVALFWLGLSGTVRNLVTERVPKRCLDRMRGMPLAGYFAAHAAFALGIAGLQAFLFTTVVFAFRHDGVYFSSCAAPAFLFVLWFVAFAGACLGLAVSAVAKKEIQAVWALPLVAILALFLSKPVLERQGEPLPTGALRAMERIMPTLHTQECLYGELGRYRDANPAPNVSKWLWFLATAGGYPLVFLPLAFFFQDRREKGWDGR